MAGIPGSRMAAIGAWLSMTGTALADPAAAASVGNMPWIQRVLDTCLRACLDWAAWLQTGVTTWLDGDVGNRELTCGVLGVLAVLILGWLMVKAFMLGKLAAERRIRNP